MLGTEAHGTGGVDAHTQIDPAALGEERRSNPSRFGGLRQPARVESGLSPGVQLLKGHHGGTPFRRHSQGSAPSCPRPPPHSSFKSATCPPVASVNALGSTGKTLLGWPAAAHTCS